MPTRDESIDLSPFALGGTYSRMDVAQLGAVTPPASVFASEWSQGIVEFANVAVLFGTFEKDVYDYRNEFEGRFFWWQTQNRQTQDSPIVARIASGELRCVLFARVRAKTGSKVEPFIYCGALSRPAMEGAHPVTCLFESLDYVEDATGPLAQIYAWRSDSAIGSEELERRSTLKRKESKGGQGAVLDTDLKNALELYGMTKAREHYEGAGWTVEDTSKNNPFDLLCQRNTESRRVEVKATTTAGESVLVTAGEVKAALDPTIETDLFVVKNIRVIRTESARQLSEGEVALISPWRPQSDELQPTQYRCKVPASNG